MIPRPLVSTWLPPGFHASHASKLPRSAWPMRAAQGPFRALCLSRHNGSLNRGSWSSPDRVTVMSLAILAILNTPHKLFPSGQLLHWIVALTSFLFLSIFECPPVQTSNRALHHLSTRILVSTLPLSGGAKIGELLAQIFVFFPSVFP